MFLGTVDASRQSLKQVIECGGQVVGVLTLAKEDAGFHSDFADLSDVAMAHDIPVHRIKNINDPGTVELVASLKPDVIFVFGWSQIIKKAILDIPSNGCIGIHPALLPRNRGRHPIVWALVKGLQESGLTFFYLDEGADSGDILWQRAFPIAWNDDAGTVYETIKALTTEAISEFLPRLMQGTAPRTPQNHDLATYWRKRNKEDGEIDWSAPSMTIYNLVRGLTRPYVGAHTYASGQQMIIWKTKRSTQPFDCEGTSKPAGTILSIESGSVCVRTGDGCLTVTERQVMQDVVLQVGDQLGVLA